MTERATVAQALNWGLEAVAGTTPAAAAFKRLQSLGVDFGIQDDHKEFRPQGTKFVTVTAQNREWTEGDLAGEWTYGECVYPLSSILGTAVVAQVMDGATPTGVYDWTFTPGLSTEDTPKTFTWEQGSAATRVHRVNYGLVRELGMEISRESLNLSGSVLAGKLADGVAFTEAAPASVELVPMMPGQFSVYMDATSAGLGTTKLTRILSASWNIGDRWNPAWFVDAAQPSWGAHVETAPDTGISVVAEADAAGMTHLDFLRSGTTRFCRIEAVGPTVYTGGITAGYRYRLDAAVQVNGVEDFSDEDGVFAVGFGLRIVGDSTWGKALQMNVRNKVAAL